MIFCAPCCHHHLQQQMKTQHLPLEFEPVCRYGIFKERLGDILTDAFRCLILNLMGYRTQIVEFVSTEHTGKNLMIRAVRSQGMDRARGISEYTSMKNLWGVTPFLESLLQEQMLALNIVPQD